MHNSLKTMWTLPSVLLLSSMLALSGCSTVPATAPLWIPPQAAMQRAKVLPKLPVAEGADPNAPTMIDLDALAKDDLDITGMYNELAKRHNALVDDVEKQLRAQAGKK